MKITWDSTAISSSSFVDVELVYYDCVNWVTVSTFTLCTYTASSSYPWAEWAMSNEIISTENYGSVSMTLNNAYEAQWAIKVSDGELKCDTLRNRVLGTSTRNTATTFREVTVANSDAVSNAVNTNSHATRYACHSSNTST